MYLHPLGDEIRIQPKAESGDPEFSLYWNLTTSSQEIRQDLVQPNAREALLKLKKPRYFLYAGEYSTAAQLPIPGMDIQMLGRQKAVTYDGALMFVKGSPLTRFMNQGM
jgi:hypothetical protein